MAAPVFPDGLPNPSSFSWMPSQQVMPSSNEGAARYVRRLSREPSAEAEVVWQLTSPQNATFWAWWRTDLLNGHRWFIVNIPSAVGIRLHLVRFINHPKRTLIGAGYSKLECKIEVLNRRIQNDILNLYVTSTLYPVLGYDSMTSGFAVISGSFRSPTLVDDSMTSSISITSATLSVLLKSTEYQESVQPTLSVQSAQMPVILRTLDVGFESVQPSVEILSGSLVAILISSTIPTESIASTFTITSASLA